MRSPVTLSSLGNVKEPAHCLSAFRGILIQRADERFFDIRGSGVELCDIELGKLGAYVQYNVKAWDYATSRVILEELGCKFTDMQGRDISWVYNGGVIAALPDVHHDIMSVLKIFS